MENDGSEPVEEMDEQREEWWETQRKIFRGRVDSFIAKMHLIQGNRRFSPWKGSVTDSVVGVYLTQNTNDHLSSSAFMCVAARYPCKIRTKELTFQDEFTASQESVASNTKIYEGFSKDNETEQDLDLCISLPHVSHASQTTDLVQDKPCVNEFATSQESVASNTKVDEGFSKNNEIEQYLDLCPSCPDVSDASQTIDLVQEKLCVNEDSNNFRKCIEVEEGDYLKQFCGSPLNESRVDEEEQKTDSFEFPCSHEPSVTTFDLNVSFCETSESEFIGQVKSTPEEPKVVTPICTLQSEVATKGVNGVNNHESLKDKPLETKSTGKKKNRVEENQEPQIDWEELRKSYCEIGEKEVNENHMDAVDWDVVRLGTCEELAKTIVERGMSNRLAGRIKDFLDRMRKEHGSHDLEWLRDVPPDKAKFTSLFNHDNDSMPRVWSGKEDIPAITKTARSSSLKLLSVLAAIRLDEETDTIGDTLVLTLVDPKKGTRKSTSDPLASSTWEDLPGILSLSTKFLPTVTNLLRKLAEERQRPASTASSDVHRNTSSPPQASRIIQDGVGGSNSGFSSTASSEVNMEQETEYTSPPKYDKEL